MLSCFFFFFFNDTATTEIYTFPTRRSSDLEQRFLGLYTFSAYSTSVMDIPLVRRKANYVLERAGFPEESHNEKDLLRSEEHTSELQSRQYLVCRLLLEKKKKTINYTNII